MNSTILNQQTGAGVADVVVFLDANHNGVLDNNEVFAITDANGNYTFTFLATGLGDYSTYQVTVMLPSNSTVTGETVSGSSVPYAFDISLQANGQSVTSVDFFLLFPPPGGGT